MMAKRSEHKLTNQVEENLHVEHNLSILGDQRAQWTRQASNSRNNPCNVAQEQ